MRPRPVYSTSTPVRIETQEVEMPASVLYMSMSVDGDVAAPHDGAGSALVRICVVPAVWF
jgi:hypothetical protein